MSGLFFRLDPDKETPSNDETILDSERSFLELVAYGSTHSRFLVQGRVLCHWVQEWCCGREIAVEYIRSPRVSWRHWNPHWTDEEIAQLQHQSRILYAPATFAGVLSALFETGPFFTAPSLTHAAEWALWLAQAKIPSTAPCRPILRSQANTWRDNIDEGDLLLRMAYSLDHSETASHFLHEWLLEGRFGIPFPIPFPDGWKDMAEQKWRFELLERGCRAFWEMFDTRHFSPELRQLAAHLISIHLKHHTEQIDSEILLSLKPYLPANEWNELRQACPPILPVLVPVDATPDFVLNWFAKEYLPFREWQLSYTSQGPEADIALVAQSFVEWVLAYYPQAIGGGSGYEYLAIEAATKLQQTQDVILWVILDGMPVSDGNALRDMLQNERRFTIAENRLCFTTLPTITCFCKPALMNGCPAETLDITETPTPKFNSAILLRDKTMRDQVAQAQNGQVLLWSSKEPDATYHRNQSRATTLAEVASQLSLLANRIRELAFGIPEHLNVTVFVSTDHGRLLAVDIERTHRLPDSAFSEGRTAWGAISVSPPEGLVPLKPERFRLPESITAWVATDANAFVQSNGSGGKVAFPHGGLWPEEVIVPWFSFVRDAKLPALQISLQGSGRTGGWDE